MIEQRKVHPGEEVLENYALDRLAEPALGELEEHLLVCGFCQERLDEVTEYVSLMREAAGKLAARAPAESAVEPMWKRWLRLDWLPMPMPALVGALVVLVALLAWQPWQDVAPSEWRTVDLATMRGGTDAGAAVEGMALELRLDVSGIDVSGAVAQLVNGEGTLLRESAVYVGGVKAELRYEKGLKAGQYWVRLKKRGETVREYSLVVRSR